MQLLCSAKDNLHSYSSFFLKMVFYRFQLLHILCCLLEMAVLILSHFPSNYCLRNNAHWKCWENWYYNSQFPRAATGNIGTSTVVEEPKLKKEEQKIRLRFLFVCWFWTYMGKPNIRPRSSQNLECQRAGPNPGRRAGTRIPSTNYRKKYWCFRTKYHLHTCLENKNECSSRSTIASPCTTWFFSCYN